MEIIKKYYAKVIYIMFIALLAMNSFQYFEKKGVILMSFGLLALMIITLIILIKFNKSTIAKQFLVIALIWGIAFAFVNPVYLVPDESVHIYRAYDLAKGRVFYRGNENSGMLPASIQDHDKKVWQSYDARSVKQFLNTINTPLEKDNEIWYNTKATSAYNSIAYIPSAIGMFIGNSLNLAPYFIIMLGRITNLLVWITLCYLAIKFISIKKELLFILILIPMGMQQAASCSPDALLNSSSFLLIAYILYLKFEKEKVTFKDELIILMLVIFIASIKLPYAVIAGTLILIPNKKYNFGLLEKIGMILAVIIVSIGLMVGWNKVSKPEGTVSNVKIVESIDENGEVIREEVKVLGYSDTIKEVIKNPKVFIDKVIYTLQYNADFYRASFTAYFGWFKILASHNFRWMLILGLIVFALKGDENGHKLKVFDKIIFALMTIGMYLVLCLVSLQWSQLPVSKVVFFDGIQGRYFYPFIIGIFLVLQNTKLTLKINKYWLNSYRNAYVCWTLAFSLAMIYIGYFS